MRLRAHRLEDLDACVAMWADPIVTRHIGGKPFTREETWSEDHALCRPLGCSWDLAIGRLKTRRPEPFLGEGGFARSSGATCGRRSKRMPEIGWALIPPAHGKDQRPRQCAPYAPGAIRTSDRRRPSA